MTHTLHRFGTPEDLAHDFVVFAMSAKGINEVGSADKLRRFMDIALSHAPINAGDMKTGNMFSCSREELLNSIQDVSIVHAVYTDEATVAAVLQELAAADLGVSVVVSGLTDGVDRCAHAAGLKRHTTEWSLGVWGRTDKLPDKEVMEITTMCGHGMVSAEWARRKAQLIRRGQETPDEAAHDLARQCVCGVFNVDRAARLLAAMAARPVHPAVHAEAGQTTA